MKDNVIIEKSMAFSVRIVNLCKYLSNEKKEYVISRQICKSGTRIGANIAEAVYGSSRKDFVFKLQIARKEAAETAYWLELLYSCSYLTEKQFDSMKKDCIELMAMLSASIKSCED